MPVDSVMPALSRQLAGVCVAAYMSLACSPRASEPRSVGATTESSPTCDSARLWVALEDYPVPLGGEWLKGRLVLSGCEPILSHITKDQAESIAKITAQDPNRLLGTVRVCLRSDLTAAPDAELLEKLRTIVGSNEIDDWCWIF